MRQRSRARIGHQRTRGADPRRLHGRQPLGLHQHGRPARGGLVGAPVAAMRRGHRALPPDEVVDLFGAARIGRLVFSIVKRGSGPTRESAARQMPPAAKIGTATPARLRTTCRSRARTRSRRTSASSRASGSGMPPRASARAALVGERDQHAAGRAVGEIEQRIRPATRRAGFLRTPRAAHAALYRRSITASDAVSPGSATSRCRNGMIRSPRLACASAALPTRLACSVSR